MKDLVNSRLAEIKKKQEENKVKFKWQDTVLALMQDLSLPRKMHADPDKKPLDVTGMLMRQAKKDRALFERRFALIKEKGLTGESAVKYYMGIVESENN